jgi:hypothetical protein
VARSVDVFGTITAIDITNHGVGYTTKPSIVSSDSSCLCGGQPGSLPGVFEQCFNLKVKMHNHSGVGDAWLVAVTFM